MSASKPLAGFRILSVEQFAAGPYGTMFLADLGAEVIKIENPAVGGDPARYGGPFMLGEADSEYFQTWNLNKHSIAIDLKSPAGRAAFDELAARADAVVDNLRGDLPAKLGLDYRALSKLRPSIVCVHISAYGRDTSRAAWPGYDYLMQAESGLMHLTGEPEGPPARFGAPSMIDHMTGMTAMVGLLAALLRARESGRGCDVDVSLLDVALHQLGYAAIWYLNEGVCSSRQPRSAHFSVGPVQTLRTQDGWIFLMCMTEKFWRELVDILARPDLEGDPRFATPGSRGTHRQALTQILDEELSRQPMRHWLDAFKGRLPAAPVLDVATALESDFVAEAGMIRPVPHPSRPDFRVLSNPLKIDGERLDLRVCSPLGADGIDALADDALADDAPADGAPAGDGWS
ncbi:MAG: CaiB/BaiF CoA transferase family protein [Steroidobacteraceae bacterium]